MNPAETPLGYVFEYSELMGSTEAVWGSIAWPSAEQPGFLVILAAGKQRHRDGYEISILDESESFDVAAIVRQAVAMDSKYWISQARTDQSGDPRGRWIADETHDAARKFVAECNAQFAAELPPPRLPGYRRVGAAEVRRLDLTQTMLTELEHLYDYLLPKIQGWTRADRQLLHLKDSKVLVYMNEFDAIDASDISGLKAGHMPAIEALGCGCAELQAYLQKQLDSRVHEVYHSSDMGVQNI
jgi:hypothetical protein